MTELFAISTADMEEADTHRQSTQSTIGNINPIYLSDIYPLLKLFMRPLCFLSVCNWSQNGLCCSSKLLTTFQCLLKLLVSS